MGAEGSERIEGTGVGGTGAVVGGVGGTTARSEEAGAGGSALGYATGGRFASGISAAGWSLRRKMKGTWHSLPLIDSKGGLAAAMTLQSGLDRKPMCSSIWHRSYGNRRGVDSARGRLWWWTLSSKWNKDVMISSAGLNQKPLEIRYKASKMAPLL